MVPALHLGKFKSNGKGGPASLSVVTVEVLPHLCLWDSMWGRKWAGKWGHPGEASDHNAIVTPCKEEGRTPSRFPYHRESSSPNRPSWTSPCPLDSLAISCCSHWLGMASVQRPGWISSIPCASCTSGSVGP
jgi:hypothetical protein